MGVEAVAKRTNKIEMRKKRLWILAEISRLDGLRCDLCTDEIEGNSLGNRTNCDCAAAVKVRKLGEQLSNLVSNRKKIEFQLPPKPKAEGLTVETLTIDIYKKFKTSNMTDTQIMRELKVGTKKFHKWKRENGLMAVKSK